jgi:hypothetical protein
MIFTKDECPPDYKVHWLDKSKGIRGFNKIFTYGHGKELAVASFKLLYPNHEICFVERLQVLS